MGLKMLNQTETQFAIQVNITNIDCLLKFWNIFLFPQVNEDEKVSTVKELVSERLNIPANQQRLLYKGKALAGKLPLSRFPLDLCMIAIGIATNSFCNKGDLYRYIDCRLYCFFQMSTDWVITLLDQRLNWIWSFVLWGKGVERQ